MSRTLGLARIICRGCGAEQLATVTDLVADAPIQCSACNERESAASVLGRYEELAGLVNLMRDLQRASSNRNGETGASPRRMPARAGSKERV